MDDFNEGTPSESSLKDEAAARSPTQGNTLISGRRKPKDIYVETYSMNPIDERKGLFPPHLVFNSEQAPIKNGEGEQPNATPKAKPKPETEGFLTFTSGNPFVETTRGILHLYKENTLTSPEAGSERCNTICILSVPATMTCRDLLNFTAPYHQEISHLRIIKNGSPNQYMVLVTFRTKEMACGFFTAFNGEPFNSLEPESLCHMVFVSTIEVEEANPEPPIGHTELPTCTVCLERMDESVDGILTILCNHSFHSNCLARWGDTSCPVCRYVSTPEPAADNRCLQCMSVENLWMCLICGHVGCGRYVEGHAFKHYLATNHTYAMLLGTTRVWDYAGDNFVHRLVQNKGDGKLVETKQSSQEVDDEDKMDAIQLEWTYSLTSQLEKQREFYEEKLNRLQASLGVENAETKQKLLEIMQENKELKASLKQVKRDKANLEKKTKNVQFKIASTLSEINEERVLSRALLQTQSEWQTKYFDLEKKFQKFKNSKEEEIFKLKDQLRDIMFSLNAGQEIAASDARDEIASGQIIIGAPAPTPAASTSARHRRRRRK